MKENRENRDGAYPISESTTRPWGFFETFAMNEQVTVKILHVSKGQMLSLQRHQHRDQLYVAIDPITVIYEPSEGVLVERTLAPGDKAFFPAGALHRAGNDTDLPFARYLEVSFGDYDENDIERVEDLYGRR